MSDLLELYQQVILDHYKKPRNFQKLKDATCQAEGHNPLCGDEITVYIGPLRPGRYEFFGDFHPDTARGHIVVK